MTASPVLSMLLAMSDLSAARAQMTLSLAFHMIFAAIGIGLPLIMVITEWRWLKGRGEHYLALTKQCAKLTGLLFAIGAVSGTALSFELGLLWPRYMEVMGAAVGHLFGLEGFAFFIEAIFIGLYLYGWDKMPRNAHWLCGVVVAVSGALSGILVLGVNAWMQLPVGVEMVDGQVVKTDPLAIFKTKAWWTMAVHSTLACYISVGFAFAGLAAWSILRGKGGARARSALRVGAWVGGICAVLQLVSGDLIAKFVAETQPVKFAAMEAHRETSTYAPIVLGPEEWGLKIPGALSFLAKGKFSAEVKGLNDVPKELHPNVALTHLAFDVMVGCGTLLVLAAVWFAVTRWRKMEESRWLLRLFVLCLPLGFVALEAGWVVTEVGRQPWIIQGIMKTREAVTSAGGISKVLAWYTALYLLLAVMSIVLGRYVTREKQVQAALEEQGGGHA